MKTFFRNNRTIIAITFIALLLRLSAFLILKPWDEKVVAERIVQGDAIGYQALAINLLNSAQFKQAVASPKKDDENLKVALSSQYDTLRTPGYPCFLCIIYFLFGVKIYIVILVQIVLNIVSLLLLVELSKTIFKNLQIAHIATLLFAIEPHQIYYSLLLYTDTLFVTMFLLFSVLLAKGLENKSVFYFVLSAIILGVSILIRPIAKFVPFLVIFILLIVPKWQYPFKIKIAVTYLVLCSIVVSFWLYRNYREYNHFSLCTDQGVNLLVRNAANMEALRTHTSNPIIMGYLQKEVEKNGFDIATNPFDKESICSRIAIKYISCHFFYYIRAHLEGIFSIFVATDHRGIAKYLGIPTEIGVTQYALNISTTRFFSDNLNTILIGVYIVLISSFEYFVLIIGSFFMFRNRMSKIWLVIFIVITYFSGLTGILGLANGSRFKLPITPFYILIGSYGLYMAIHYREFISRRIKQQMFLHPGVKYSSFIKGLNSVSPQNMTNSKNG